MLERKMILCLFQFKIFQCWTGIAQNCTKTLSSSGVTVTKLLFLRFNPLRLLLLPNMGVINCMEENRQTAISRGNVSGGSSLGMSIVRPRTLFPPSVLMEYDEAPRAGVLHQSYGIYRGIALHPRTALGRISQRTFSCRWRFRSLSSWSLPGW